MRNLFLIQIVLALALSGHAAARDAPRPEPPVPDQRMLYSTSADGLAARETTGPDTFALYGGPEAGLEGKFETAGGAPDFQGWTPVDLTETALRWQVSTFNAENLNGQGPGNHAFWCGSDESQEPGWSTPPGYGNNWIQDLVWESPPVADPGVGQDVSLDFFFNTDLEPWFDHMEVAYESYGSWQPVYLGSGINDNVQYSSIDTLTALPIRYDPNSYAGENNDRIRLRIQVFTDAIWSDEDGGYPSNGAAQIDDVSIEWSGGSEFEDFEGPGPYLLQEERAPFAGDFADVLTLLTDIDPCRSNLTPGVAFIDYGQEPRNGPAPDGTTSTGGATLPGIEYGIPGYFTVNGAGGLAAPSDVIAVQNFVTSPEIPWNLPGTADDGDEMVGALLRFDVWNHLPTEHFVGRVWYVRSRTVGGQWSEWRSRGFLYLGDNQVWQSVSEPVGDLLVEDGIPDVVQLRLGVWDLSLIFGYYGIEGATPAPVYDNVALLKHRIAGPAIIASEIDLANDAFPRAVTFGVSTPTERDAQDIAFDMARDINRWGPNIDPGDSVVVEVDAIIPGTEVADVRMFWALQKNPLFEDAIRSLPNRPRDANVTGGAQLWTGEVLAENVYTQSGGPIVNRYEMDLPDVDFLYPGDVLHYYFEATDDFGRVTTMPALTDGFLDFGEYSVFDRDFIVRGLPTVLDEQGGQPETLVIYDAEPGHETEVILAFRELGATEGIDFDTYRVNDPSGQVSNGIGSPEGHGARVEHLAGYENILYLSGVLETALSDGSNTGRDSKADDLTVIGAWAALPGTRRIAYFGDSITDPLRYSETARTWFADQVGVEWVDEDVRETLGGQFAPRVEPALPLLYTEFVASGGCFSIADFDFVRPTGLGTTAWHFLDTGGQPVVDAAAAVMKERANGFDVLFPIAFHRIETGSTRRILPSPRALLLEELFDLQIYCVTQPCTGVIPGRVAVELSAAPNPFNPITVVQFTAAAGSKGSVKVYNLRGELVRTLHSGEFHTQEFRWEGTDDRGAAVSSGVYLIQATDGSVTRTQKVALVK